MSLKEIELEDLALEIKRRESQAKKEAQAKKDMDLFAHVSKTSDSDCNTEDIEATYESTLANFLSNEEGIPSLSIAAPVNETSQRPSINAPITSMPIFVQSQRVNTELAPALGTSSLPRSTERSQARSFHVPVANASLLPNAANLYKIEVLNDAIEGHYINVPLVTSVGARWDSYGTSADYHVRYLGKRSNLPSEIRLNDIIVNDFQLHDVFADRNKFYWNSASSKTLNLKLLIITVQVKVTPIGQSNESRNCTVQSAVSLELDLGAIPYYRISALYPIKPWVLLQEPHFYWFEVIKALFGIISSIYSIADYFIKGPSYRQIIFGGFPLWFGLVKLLGTRRLQIEYKIRAADLISEGNQVDQYGNFYRRICIAINQYRTIFRRICIVIFPIRRTHVLIKKTRKRDWVSYFFPLLEKFSYFRVETPSEIVLSIYDDTIRSPMFRARYDAPLESFYSNLTANGSSWD